MTTPLGRARQDLLDAKASVAHKDTPSNRERVEMAMAHLDYLLDTLPLPPMAQELIPPGPSVSFNASGEDERVLPSGKVDECRRGDTDSKGEQ